MVQKILLIDDEEGIRKVLDMTLTDSGYQVLTAKNGEEGLQIFREMKPRIVLTDIKMPGMDGIELLQRIKKESPDTEVIMITGHGDMDVAIESLKFDATDFIAKPIHDGALDVALRRANEKISLKKKIREYTENLEKLVEEKTNKLVEAERLAAVGQTVAGLAHAIKNITGGLTGGSYVLEQGIKLNNRKYLNQGWDMIKGNVDRIKNLALDLLNYTMEREPDYQLCDPNVPVREVFDLMLPRVSEYGINLEMKLEGGLAQVWFDSEGIHRSLLNLVTNAIDACTDIEYSGGSNSVIIQSFKPEGWTVAYMVEDNGCGMDEETRAKIFKSFFSTKGTRGTGLGLMITKKIIDEHRGEITLESERGKGTKFVIKLPERPQP